VLVGGGELHDRWETLVAVRAPLSRGIQRFTGISQSMLDEAPPAEARLPDFAALMEGRVLVAHNASFDRRVLSDAFARADLEWPNPPVLCTVALARRLAPLVRQRALRPLAESLGIEVTVSHRALADAETCARVFCALFARLCAQAATLADALELCRARRGRAGSYPRARRTDGGGAVHGVRRRAPDTSGLPDAPGVYIFRSASGQPLYVGKSVSLRSRARAHFAPSSQDGDWVTRVEVVDHIETASELGALLTEHRLIGELKPPGNLVHRRRDDGWLWLRCRLDIAYPVLEVALEPAAGRAVNIGPLRARRAAVELVEQLNSLFGLRHCGRRLKRRPWASAYGQMGRCLSPCLGDLDPNLYRAQLDAALAAVCDGGGALLAHVDAQQRDAAAARRYERAAWLQRRRGRLVHLLDSIGGALEAVHARPRLVAAAHPDGGRGDLVWLVGGRVADWGEHASLDDVVARTRRALLGTAEVGPPLLTPEQAALTRVATTWIASNAPAVLELRPPPSEQRLAAFLRSEGQLGDGRRGAVVADGHDVAGRYLAAHDRQRDRAVDGGDGDAAKAADLALAEAQGVTRLPGL
jgi:DNA polymerase-3 subunit epsilon